jgi:hypothetical protein
MKRKILLAMMIGCMIPAFGQVNEVSSAEINETQDPQNQTSVVEKSVIRLTLLPIPSLPKPSDMLTTLTAESDGERIERKLIEEVLGSGKTPSMGYDALADLCDYEKNKELVYQWLKKLQNKE